MIDPNQANLHPVETLEHLTDYYYPPFITLAHLYNAPAGWALRERTLKQYALQYVVKGTAMYTVKGIPYETRQGDLLFHRPAELHSIETIDGQPYICISLLFHYGATPFPLEDIMDGAHYLGNYMQHPMEQKLSQLIVHFQQPGIAHQMQAQGLLLQILAEAAVLRDENSEQSNTQIKNKAKLILIKNQITNHFYETLNYKQLEKLSGLSRNYIILQFKKAFGMSPVEFMTWLRINKAKELAVQTNLTVSEIADRVGYSNVHSFGKMFKKKTGSSITQFCSTLFTS